MEPSTKTQILDAAEKLFAEFGFDATSLRAVTRTAGVNLAAVNYHFGTKEGLFRAVFARRIEPLNQERLERLSDIVAAADAQNTTPVLEDLLRAMLEPALRVALEPGGADFLRLMGRMHADPDVAKTHQAVLELFGELRLQFIPRFAAALPELPEVELMWRLHFVFGAMANTMTCGATLEWLTDGRCTTSDVAAAVARLVAFAAAGLRAPCPPDEPAAEDRR